MNWRTTPHLAIGLCGHLLSAQAVAVASSDASTEKRNYSVIFERNPFGLRPPPPIKSNHVPARAPNNEVFLTGIVSIGEKRAYFMSKPRAGHATEYYSLAIGEAKNSMEVLGIDPVSKTVRVRNDGVETMMSFEANGVKPPPGPNRVVRRVASTGVKPPVIVRTRPVSSHLRTIPTRTVRTSKPNLPDYSNPTATRRFAAEQDVLLMELQKTAHPHISYPPTPMPP